MIWVLFGLYLLGNLTWNLLIKKSLVDAKHYASVSAAIMFVAGTVLLATIPLFPWQWPERPIFYALPIIVALLLAISARMEVIARTKLPVSEVVIINRLRAVMFVVAAIVVLGERPDVLTLLGASSIVAANLMISYQKGKFVINKYFWELLVASALVVLSTLIDVEVSKQFNLGLFLFLSFVFRGIFFIAVDPITVGDVKDVFLSKGFGRVFLTGAGLGLSVVVTIYAFQRFDYSVFEPLRASATFAAVLIATKVNHEDNQDPLKKLLAASLVVLGVYLIAT